MMITTAQKLIELVDLAALLPAMLQPATTVKPGRTTPPGIAHSPAPVRLELLHVLDGRLRDLGDDAEDRAWHDRAAGDHRQGLLPDLYQWAKLVDGEARDAGREPADLPDESITLTAVTAWLHGQLGWALIQDWGYALARDIDWWWRHLRHLTGERDDYQPRCTLCLFPITQADGGGVWTCQGCGNETSLDAALHRLAEPLVTLTQASEITGVPLTTLKSRVASGALLPISPAGVRPAQYKLRDIGSAPVRNCQTQ
jgi:hypothetical protein